MLYLYIYIVYIIKTPSWERTHDGADVSKRNNIRYKRKTGGGYRGRVSPFPRIFPVDLFLFSVHRNSDSKTRTLGGESWGRPDARRWHHTPVEIIPFIDGRRRRQIAYRVTLNDKRREKKSLYPERFFNLLRSRGLTLRNPGQQENGPHREVFSLVTPSGI